MELPSTSYVDSLLEIIRNRRDLSSILNNQGNKFDYITITSFDSVTVDRKSSSDNDLSN